MRLQGPVWISTHLDLNSIELCSVAKLLQTPALPDIIWRLLSDRRQFKFQFRFDFPSSFGTLSRLPANQHHPEIEHAVA